ncbi:MAG: peptide chain release factor 2, partial [Paludibacter sp.]
MWTTGWEEVNQSMEDLLVLYDFYEAREASEEEITAHFNRTVELIGQL